MYVKNSGTLLFITALRNFFIIVKLKFMLCIDTKWQKLSCFWIIWRYAREKCLHA